MPKDKIRYLMGVGTPANILEAVRRGVDLFDCVMPSRNARHGHAFTWEGCRNLLNAKYELDEAPWTKIASACLPEVQPGVHPPSVQGRRDAGHAPDRDA